MTPMPARKNTETSTIAERMANFAIETGEGMTRLDLKRQGFTEEEIEAFSHEAAIIVAERTTRRVA
ncbi:hypothetical protein EUU22_18395 [Ciceribacter ferrooxidans]|uniref:Uncharacterized protein n=2 Tax=Ciceribacter ferrooxidans TaxID=2509717 RepID=A0A4V1RPP2_9HYPH|nr:hypothetical protein EUU22_18395 [Ciceribacter ferrooxidans]